MTLLLASLAVLAAGPLLYEICRGRPALPAALDGFVLVTITGIVLLHFLPEAIEAGGLVALALAAAGLFLPHVGERLFHDAEGPTHVAALAVALVGLGLHELLDGAVVATASGDDSGLVAYAVLLHRFAVALALWWLLRPAQGPARATAILAFMGLATLAGYAIGASAQAWLLGPAGGAFQGLIAGTLLHVVLHRRPSVAHDESVDRAEGMGALVGLALLVLLLARGASAAGEHGADVLEAFVGLALETAPALVLAYAAAGLASAFLPSSSVDWMRRGSRPVQALKGMALGLPFPICSCGVVPLYRSLVARGAPAAGALAFLVATPELGFDAVLVTIPLLGAEFTVVRVIAAAAVAFLVGALVGRIVPRTVAPTGGGCGSALPEASTPAERARQAVRFGLVEVVDHTAPWILLGLAIAALAAPLIEGAALASLAPVLQVPLAALLGLPTYVCASGATPLVAVLVAGGLSPGAGLAFLLTGPATNLGTVGLLGALHGRRTALAFAGAAVVLAMASGWLVDLLLPGLGRGALAAPTAESAGALQWASLAVLLALYAFSLLRRGARRFLAEGLAPVAAPDAHAVAPPGGTF